MIEAANWTAYNAAQVEEKARFAQLLSDLCGTIEQPAQGKGRPRLPLSDMTFAAVYKVYCGFSSRRFTSDLRDAYGEGLVDSTPHFNSVSRYLANPVLTPILREFVTVSSLPLKGSKPTSPWTLRGSPPAGSSDGTTTSTARRPKCASGRRRTWCAA